MYPSRAIIRGALFAGLALVGGAWNSSGLGATKSATSSGGNGSRRLLIRCAGGCDSIAAGVARLGGEVRHRYADIPVIAVQLPPAQVRSALALPGIDKVYRDAMLAAPGTNAGLRGWPGGSVDVTADGARSLDAAGIAGLAQVAPYDYSINNALTGAATLQAQGLLGQGVTVAVIDTGTSADPNAVALAGTVIGGESFVPGAGEPAATSGANGPHGSWVGTMIAGHAGFIFSNASFTLRAVQLNLPSAVIPCNALPPGSCGALDPALFSVIPMVGTAPAASIYALKVFGATEESAPESRIIAAMQRALTLRRNYNHGAPSVPIAGDGSPENPFVYDSLKIDVVNMSLGGADGFVGRDIEDELTVQMINAGIVVATSAGNDGMAAMTVGSPGTGYASLTLGASSHPGYERVIADRFFYGVLGAGFLYRPTDYVQTAYFSSRGPDADGRIDPDLLAPGDWNFVQGADGGLAFASGTSFSSPNAAGIAALLRQAVPTAPAVKIRNALIESANPTFVGDGSKGIDQGHGHIDAAAALTRLQSGHVSPFLAHGLGTPSVFVNLVSAGQFPVTFQNDRFTTHVANLQPGHVKHLFVPANDTTSQLNVRLFNVTPELPPGSQNQLFGDDLHIAIADAPTSTADWRIDPSLGESFVPAGSDITIPIDNPQTGFLRVALQGDWTNAGRVSADVEITQVRNPLGPPSDSGKVRQGEEDVVHFDIAAGTHELVVELFWDEDWSHYPTNDLDLVLVNPTGTANFDGATAASPERVVIANPPAGTWSALIDGFTVFTHDSRWKLRVTADGHRIRLH
jgi:subtilisin family serine protease